MMAVQYRAIASDGRRSRGTVWARSEAEARIVVERRGLVCLAVERSISTHPRLVGSSRDRLAILTSLSSQVSAGVSLHRALRSCASMSLARSTLSAVEVALEMLAAGESASAALERGGLIAQYVSILLRTAESTGALAQALTAAVGLERDAAETRTRIRSAMTYPSILAGTAVASFSVIFLYVLPRFASVIADTGARPTGIASGALGASVWLTKHRVGVLGLCATLIVVLIAVATQARTRAAVVAVLARTPFVGTWRQRATAAMAMRALSAMLNAGMPPGRALLALQDVIGDTRTKLLIDRAIGSVRAGSPFTRALCEAGIVPTRSLPILEVGELSGDLGASYARASTDLTAELMSQLHRSIEILQPVIVLVFGALIAFAASTVLQTLYSIRPGG